MAAPLIKAWDPTGVALSYALAVLGSLSCVLLMDQRRRIKGAATQRFFLVASALALGGGGIWSMHQMGMSALRLTNNGQVLQIGYNPLMSVGSLIVAILFTYGGLEVASKDRFFGKNQEERLDELKTQLQDKCTLGQLQTKGKWMAEYEALYAELHYIFAGGVLTASGVGFMHFTGMASMVMDAQMKWRIGVIIACVVIAITAASAAFWIIFRVLQWKPHQDGLRIASAFIMGVAVCGVHYTGMYAAKYEYRVSPIPIPKNAKVILDGAVAGEVLYCLICLLGVIISTLRQTRETEMDLFKLRKQLNHALFLSSNNSASDSSNNLNNNNNALRLDITSRAGRQLVDDLINFLMKQTSSNTGRTLSMASVAPIFATVGGYGAASDVGGGRSPGHGISGHGDNGLSSEIV